jgi:hypothetical protein
MDTNSMKYNINNGRKPNRLSCHRHSLSKISLPKRRIQELMPSYADVYRKHWWMQGRLFPPPLGCPVPDAFTISWGHFAHFWLARPRPNCSQSVSCMVPFLVKHLSCRFDMLVVAMADVRRMCGECAPECRSGNGQHPGIGRVSSL